MTECPNFTSQLSTELKIIPRSVNAVIDLLKAGNTVPFIARYRKEVTGNLDEVQIRTIEERLQYLQELASRRETILESISSQGKLTDDLRKQIISCVSKTELEDLYLPYKPKRRTRAMIAREKGLLPLAELILLQSDTGSPKEASLPFINIELEIPDVETALKGARDIVSELISEKPEIRTYLREEFERKGEIHAQRKNDVVEPTKYEQYYDFKEPIKSIPSHRFLAIARGERENILGVDIELDVTNSRDFMITTMGVKNLSPFAHDLQSAVDDALKRLLLPTIRTDVWVALKMNADRLAIDVFAENLRNILLASPMGAKTVIGIDPGLRTGCKCAVVQDSGKFVGNVTIFLHGSPEAQEKSKQLLLALIKAQNPVAIAVGNGTGGRETENWVKSLLKEHGLEITLVSVSESGASVYSASDVAREEFPDLDLTIRGAISIARRLQDPLAELVKVEPKAMGVGQYQHDVYQPLLERKLADVVESCVNQVGVLLNTASAPLLSYVAGIGPSLAKNIVQHREQNGPFRSRKQLIDVPGLGKKTFEQAAGFLRVHQGEHPLDASAVHPERYAVVENIAKDLHIDVASLIGNNKAIERIVVKNYVNDDIGELTLKDIIEELKKPGRDPRAQFEKPAFRDDVNAIGDLKKGMILSGIVTNVTAFGAFVDIGVHQDGLVHVSQLSHQFVKDPSSIVKTGDKIQVEVLDVDIVRKRISLTACIGKKPSPKNNLEKPPQPKTNTTLGSLASFARLNK